ncbi:MAG: DUF2780 domain-containing protein [Steroidobacteraceae bacterium]
MKELIDLLTTQLKIEPKQASGGAAILFKAAQDKLGADQFGKLLGGVAGVDDLVRQAPSAGGMGKLFGGFATSLGGGNAAAIAGIVSGFGKLGLNATHAQQFVPVIMQFLRGKVGQDVVATLEKTLRA